MKTILLLALVTVSAFAVWPADPWENCNAGSAINNQGKEIKAPELYSHAIQLVAAGADPNTVEGHDHLELIWRIHGSYTIASFWSENGTHTIGAANAEDTVNHHWKVEYTPPNTGTCEWGVLKLKLFLGVLKEWGFATVKDNVAHTMVLNGSFWIDMSRWVCMMCDDPTKYEPSDAYNVPQRVITTFPVKITINTEFNVGLEKDITAYGIPETAASIILFKEHPHPAQIVTIWYLISVQYPFEFSTGTSTFSSTPPAGKPIEALSPRSIVYYLENQGWCDTDDKWCYQVVRVDYRINAICKDNNNDLRFNGQYRVDATIQCRVALVTGTWCQIPTGMNWEHPFWTFEVTSNNICERQLTYDPSTLLTGNLYTYPTDYQSSGWPAANRQTSFVPDNGVWFVVDLDISNPATFPFNLNKVTILNITFNKIDAATPIVIYNGGWLTASYNYHFTTPPGVVATDLVLQHDSPTLLLGGLPVAYFALNMSSSLNNLKKTTPFTYSCLVYVEVDYAWKSSGASFKQVAQLQSKDNKIVGAILSNAEWISNGAGIAPSTSAGVVAGVVVGTVAFVGAVAALIILKRRQKAGFAKQMDSTTA